MAIVMGGQPISLQRNFGSSKCNLCHVNSKDDPSHLMFECSQLSEIRQAKIQQIYAHMPVAMVENILQMNVCQKTLFILSPLRSSYTPEWNDIYVSIASMVFAIYTERAKIYDQMDL